MQELELIYSDKWKEKDNDRKDLTYSPLSKNLMTAVYFPIDDRTQTETLLKIIERLICKK